jgi:arabinogalactan oligomer/maltooligosaccharide transport system permease protein
MALSYLALLVFTLFALYPVAAVVSFVVGPKPRGEVSGASGLTNANFSDLFHFSFLRWDGNAALVSFTVAVAGLSLSSVVGFILSRWSVRRRSRVVRSPLPQVLPALICLVPLIFILFRFGQFRSLLWACALYLVMAAPICCWQLKRAYDAISPSVEEAAVIDGCGSWKLFYGVILPPVAPGLILTGLFSFLVAWNDFIVVQLILQDRIFPWFSREGCLWALSATGILLAALLVGFCLTLADRFHVSDGTAAS